MEAYLYKETHMFVSTNKIFYKINTNCLDAFRHGSEKYFYAIKLQILLLSFLACYI